MKGIGYQSSKSDRAVLKWVFITCFVAALAIGLTVVLVLRSHLWRPQVKRASARLDAVLADQSIDAVEFIYPGGTDMVTNSITGKDAQKLLGSLHRTNRIASLGWNKGQVQSVCFRSGTNVIGWLSVGDDGTWSYEEYEFRLRQ
jgi:hypothetical protein